MIRHVLSIVIPGVGQVQQDRHLSGLVFFFLFAFALNGLLVGPLIIPAATVPLKTLKSICIASAGTFWILSAFDYFRAEGRRRAAAPATDEN